MNNRKPSVLLRFLVGIVVFNLLSPAWAIAQDDKKAKEREEKQQKKEEKQQKKEEKRIDTQVRKYEDARLRAKKKYDEGGEFKEDVDNAFRDILRRHARLAFETNITDSDDVVTTRSGDKVPVVDDTLYDNILAQDYINRVGQSLVPQDSTKRYGFKILLNPIPEARSLSTGTVYVSTGLLSLVDNEAQLAYVLGHEIGHVEKDHWKEDLMVAKQIEAENRAQEKKAAIAGAIIGGVTGGILGGGDSAATGALLGAGVALYTAKLFDPKAFQWGLAQEDEADRLALGYMLQRNYDVRETQQFYQSLKTAALDDPRIELNGFGDRNRTDERTQATSRQLSQIPNEKLSASLIGASNYRGKALNLERNLGAATNRINQAQAVMSDDIKLKIQNGDLLAGDGEFDNIMSLMRRDNGIVAFYYDMYKLAARNLEQSLAVRSDDALAYFYYGKVLKLTARKPGEKEKALQVFTKAIELDQRRVIPHARLYYALTKMSGRTINNVQEVAKDLKDYVNLYQRVNGGLPPNMEVIYDYLQEAGDVSWVPGTASTMPSVNAASAPATPALPTTTPATGKRKP